MQTVLSTLEHLNLVSLTSTTIWVATSLDDLQDPELRQLAAQMLSNIGHANTDRGVRMPRRMLVFLMTSQRPRPVYAGVMLALLIRTMLTKRYGAYKGCCTAAWIALVFGGDASSIKSARAKLIADGWTQERWDRAANAYKEQGTLALWRKCKNSRPPEAAIDGGRCP